MKIQKILGIAAVMFVFGSVPNMAYAADAEADDLLVTTISDINVAASNSTRNCRNMNDEDACAVLKKMCSNRGNGSVTCQRRNSTNITINCKNRKPVIPKRHVCYTTASSSFTPATGGAAEITQD